MISKTSACQKLLSLSVVLAFVFASCTVETEEAYIAEVIAFDYAFQAPAEIPSGWITFELNNKAGHEIHEISIAKIPEGISYSQYLEEYVGAWEILLKEYLDGEIEREEIGARVTELLPEWEHENSVEYVNARGLLSPGRIASETIYLEPGNYALDCWIKTEEGIIHISAGMTRKLTVNEESANSPEPSPDVSMTLHSESISVENWEPQIGSQQFAVYLDADDEGNQYHNNIHLIKLSDDTDLAEVNRWMDWYELDGLHAPAPADFLGGTSTYDADLGDGAVYFSVNITEPGEYAWIVHSDPDNPLWKTFTVSE